MNDKSSSKNPYESVAPQLLNIFKIENAEQYQVTPNYLHSSVLVPGDPVDQGVSERCRRRTCEWMYDICDYFLLNREVVGIALFYVDRYFTITFDEVTSQEPVTRRQFQLVALTGLYMAVKLHGEGRQDNITCQQSLTSSSQPDNSQPWNRRRSDFSLAVCASISRDQFILSEIEDCERNMLNVLDWHMNPIVASGTVIDSLVAYLPSNMNGSPTIFVYDSAKYLSELSVSVPALNLVYKPSVVAYASILYALDTLCTKRPHDTCCTSQARQDYEELIFQASSQYFCREKVDGAKQILQAICSNLSDLFTLPPMTPQSPTSVNMFS